MWCLCMIYRRTEKVSTHKGNWGFEIKFVKTCLYCTTTAPPGLCICNQEAYDWRPHGITWLPLSVQKGSGWIDNINVLWKLSTLAAAMVCNQQRTTHYSDVTSASWRLKLPEDCSVKKLVQSGSGLISSLIFHFHQTVASSEILHANWVFIVAIHMRRLFK